MSLVQPEENQPLLSIFGDLKSFEDLEPRLCGLTSDEQQATVLRQCYQAYFAAQPRFQVKQVWRTKDIPKSILNRLGLTHPKSFHIHSAFINSEEALTVVYFDLSVPESELPADQALQTQLEWPFIPVYSQCN